MRKNKIKMWIARMFQYGLFFFVPIRKNRIMLYAHNQKGYVGNPRAIMEYLLQHEPGKYELIWATIDPESCQEIQGVKVVGRRSFSYFYYFIRTKYYITNDMADENLIKKKGQIFISTWHGGGAYKKVGLSTVYENAELAKCFGKWYHRLDYFISSCRKSTLLFSEAFGLETSQFLEIGMPRNDIFFREYGQISEKVRRFYHLNEKTKILLFAPSFQNHAVNAGNDMLESLLAVTEELRERTGEDWILLYRTHHYYDQTSCKVKNKILDGNQYYDMQDLLCASNVLVTDVSSSIWDFALTGRPVILSEDQLEEYEEKDRGFFVPYKKWPYFRVKDMKEIVHIVIEDNRENLVREYAEHYKEMGSFETGMACLRFAEFLKDKD